MEFISRVPFFPWVSNELDQFVTQLAGGSERYTEQRIADVVVQLQQVGQWNYKNTVEN